MVIPTYALYRAIESPSPTQLKPWLIYWTVYAVVLTSEAQLSWLLTYIPMYLFLRLLFLGWLVLPVALYGGAGLPRESGCGVLYYGYLKPAMEGGMDTLADLNTYQRIHTQVSSWTVNSIFAKYFHGLSPRTSSSATSPTTSTTGGMMQTIGVLLALVAGKARDAAFGFALPTGTLPSGEPVNLFGSFMDLCPGFMAGKPDAPVSQRTVSPLEAATLAVGRVWDLLFDLVDLVEATPEATTHRRSSWKMWGYGRGAEEPGEPATSTENPAAAATATATAAATTAAEPAT